MRAFVILSLRFRLSEVFGEDRGKNGDFFSDYNFFKSLAGRVIIALKKSRIAVTVIPISRKGMSKSHMSG
jgi:hypothetical protein